MPSTGENIRARRQALGITQKTLAERVGSTETTVGRWERDESEPRGGHFAKLAEALETTVAELYSPPESNRTPADGGASVTSDLDDMVIP